MNLNFKPTPKGAFEAEFEAKAAFALYVETEEPSDFIINKKSVKSGKYSPLQAFNGLMVLDVEIAPKVCPKWYKIESKTAPKTAVLIYANE